MISQKELIEQMDWNNLIILDACRFDFFENVYKDYLDGELRKVVSSGSGTLEWLEKTFPGQYDVTYFSANPYVNSRDISFGGLNPAKHFSKIIDAWLTCWNEERGTVLPADLNKAVLNNLTDGRIIVHYIQPHLPFIALDSIGSRAARNAAKGDIFLRLRASIGPKLRRVLGKENILKIKQIFNLGETPWEKMQKKYSVQEIRYYYEDNLRRVMEAVSDLVPHLREKTVITSDHGERLGENEDYGHEYGSENSLLVEVPWFEVERTVSKFKGSVPTEKARILRIVRHLKSKGKL
jgi:hypothetical protein